MSTRLVIMILFVFQRHYLLRRERMIRRRDYFSRRRMMIRRRDRRRIKYLCIIVKKNNLIFLIFLNYPFEILSSSSPRPVLFFFLLP